MRIKPRRNRKRKEHHVAYLPVSFAGLFVIGVTLAVAYVWLCLRCEFLGNEIKALENQKKALSKQYQNHASTWTVMKAPPRLIKRLATYGIVMELPPQERVRRVTKRDLYADAWHGGLAESPQLAIVQRSRRHE